MYTVSQVGEFMIKKPFLRGHFHQAAFFVALGSCIMLVLKTDEGSSLWATLIYSISLIFLLGVSALYHRINWPMQKRLFMKRLDHSAIYFLIAGTFTPVCLHSLNAESAQTLLITIWTVAFFGVLQSLFFINSPKWLSAIFYVVAGYLILPYLPEINQQIGLKNVMLLVGGGLAYTIGALSYALKKPNFYPEVFGYHEVFHLWVIVGAILHFTLIYNLI